MPDSEQTTLRPAPRGEQLSGLDELLLRQIKPAWLDGETVSSQNFRPASSDHDLLSVSRSSLISPSDCFALFIARGLQSVGVMGVTVAETTAAGVAAWGDPEPDLVPPDPAHAVIDFRALPSRGAREKAGKKLLAAAVARGWLHR